MEFALAVLENAGKALAGLALNPFYYAGLLFALLVYRRQVAMQRRLFYTRLHASVGVFLHTLLWGWICGLVATVLLLGVGLAVNAPTMLWVWGTTLVLALFRIRYWCTIYAAGTVILLHEAVRWIAPLRELPVLGEWLASLLSVHPPSLLALAALLYAAEALLIRLHGERLASPLYVGGLRGKIIGAYQLQAFWAVPLFPIVPAAAGAGLAEWLPWPRMLGGAEWEAGWTLMAFPVMIGFAGLSATALPKRTVRRISAALLAIAPILAALSAASERWPPLAIAGAVIALFFHEWVVLHSERRERRGKPYFIQTGKGLKVLGVVPGSPAAEMGIAAGETVVKVNGEPVSTGEQLHAALRGNSAFCKLEAIDLNGESKFARRALFDGEPHQLGIVLCPDDRVPFHARWRSPTLLTLFTPEGLSKRRHAKPDDRPDAGGGEKMRAADGSHVEA